jgi:hypothetical protein
MSDPILKPVEHFAERTAKLLGHDVGQAGEKVMRKAATGVEEVAGNATKTEAKHIAEIEAIGKTRKELTDGIGDTPVYRIRDNRVVERLTKDGAVPLTAEDRARLPLKLNRKNQVPRRRTGDKNPYKLPELKKGDPVPRKHSTRVDPGETDLAKATQLARHEDHSFGNYNKDPDNPDGHKFSSNNYAAARYGEKGNPDSFIIVGRSRFPTHSERVLGTPFLQSGTAGGITELYTEREPCTSRANCSRWMDTFLPGHVKVSHSFEYGFDDSSQKAGNAAMENYLNGLNPRPSKHAPTAP